MDSGGKWQRSVKATADMRFTQQRLRVLFLLILTDLFKMMKENKLLDYIVIGILFIYFLTE